MSLLKAGEPGYVQYNSLEEALKYQVAPFFSVLEHVFRLLRSQPHIFSDTFTEKVNNQFVCLMRRIHNMIETKNEGAPDANEGEWHFNLIEEIMWNIIYVVVPMYDKLQKAVGANDSKLIEAFIDNCLVEKAEKFGTLQIDTNKIPPETLRTSSSVSDSFVNSVVKSDTKEFDEKVATTFDIDKKTFEDKELNDEWDTTTVNDKPMPKKGERPSPVLIESLKTALGQNAMQTIQGRRKLHS